MRIAQHTTPSRTASGAGFVLLLLYVTLGLLAFAPAVAAQSVGERVRVEVTGARFVGEVTRADEQASPSTRTMGIPGRSHWPTSRASNAAEPRTTPVSTFSILDLGQPQLAAGSWNDDLQEAVRRSHAKKGALIGAGVGFAVGAAIALSVPQCADLTLEELFTTECTDRGKVTGFFVGGGIVGAIGGLVGLGVGALIRTQDVGGRTFEPVVDVGRDGRTTMSVRLR